MTSLLTSQWLDACVLVPADDFTIITKLAAKAANEGQIIADLSELRSYALNTDVDDAERFIGVETSSTNGAPATKASPAPGLSGSSTSTAAKCSGFSSLIALIIS